MLAVGLCVATGMLVWLAYRATLESNRSARLLLQRRADEQLALLWAGITQDMKGAQATVLAPITHRQLVLEPPYDLADAFARGFARFPYPESFFAWTASGQGDGLSYFFNRTERRPAWQAPEPLVGPYPVNVVRDPPAGRAVLAQARRQATQGRPFAVFETELAGVPYQVVAHLLYQGDRGSRLFGLVGFTVNLSWVRNVYFDELTRQIAGIGGDPREIALAVADDVGVVVTATRPADRGTWARERRFPLAFVDRALLQTLPRHESPRYWSARAGLASGPAMSATVVGGTGTFVLVSLAAVAALVGLLVTVRAARASANLATMKSEFVSSVTHELKTPLASIRLIADTLAQGRYEATETIRDYAKLLSVESQELTRLVDNLLTYARLSDVDNAYCFELTYPGDLIEDVVERFRALLHEQRFTTVVDVAPELPPIRGDRSALLQVLENVIDNSIRYSNEDGQRILQIRASAVDGQVTISVIDSGIGIHEDELAHVCDKFFRGRDVKTRGSGLGLAIARHIVDVHRGRLMIDSARGKGTRVDVVLPVSRV